MPSSSGFEGRDLGLHTLDHLARVLAVPHHDHAADRLLAVEVECAAAKGGTGLHLGHVAHAHRNSVAGQHDRVFDLLQRFRFGFARADEALAADEILHAARLRPSWLRRRCSMP